MVEGQNSKVRSQSFSEQLLLAGQTNSNQKKEKTASVEVYSNNFKSSS